MRLANFISSEMMFRELGLILLASTAAGGKCKPRTTDSAVLQATTTTTMAPVTTTSTIPPVVITTKTTIVPLASPTATPMAVVNESDACDYQGNKGRVHQWRVCNGVDFFVCGNSPFPALIKMKCSAGTACKKNPISTWPDIDCH